SAAAPATQQAAAAAPSTLAARAVRRCSWLEGLSPTHGVGNEDWISIPADESPHACERPHDLKAHSNRGSTSENAREHRDTLFRERPGEVPPAAPGRSRGHGL